MALDVANPLLSRDACQLLADNLVFKEREVWGALGKLWRTPL